MIDLTVHFSDGWYYAVSQDVLGLSGKGVTQARAEEDFYRVYGENWHPHRVNKLRYKLHLAAIEPEIHQEINKACNALVGLYVDQRVSQALEAKMQKGWLQTLRSSYLGRAARVLLAKACGKRRNISSCEL